MTCAMRHARLRLTHAACCPALLRSRFHALPLAPDLRLRAATSHHNPPHCSRLQGGGIQIQQGPKAGRLVVPTIAVYSNASSCPISSDCWAAGTHDHALVSDDGGITWASGTPCAKRTRLFHFCRDHWNLDCRRVNVRSLLSRLDVSRCKLDSVLDC